MNHPLIRRYLTLALLLASIGISHADYDAGWAAYERGDYATALREFRPLAQQGDAKAQYNLGWMYHNGQGVVQDYTRAHMWANLAASNGADTIARNLIAIVMTPAAIEKAQSLALACAAKNYQDC